MLFRRVLDHVKAQNWTAVGIDFLIVVLGVFIGLQVSNWNDLREERAKESLYLARLAQDFDVIMDRLETGLNAARSSVEAGQVLIEYIETAPGGGDGPDRDEASQALGRIGASSVPAGPSATFSELVSTGDLSILRDEALRNALFEYDLVSSSNRESWRVLRQNIIEEQRTIFSYFEATFEVSPENVGLQITGFNEAGFLADARTGPAVGVIAGISINEYQLLNQQLERAKRVRELIDE